MTDRTPANPGDSSGIANGCETLELELVLHELQSPINIGMILRIAEVYQFTVSLLDRHGVLDDPQKLPTISDFACGALSRRPLNRLQDASALSRLRRGRRLIVTSIGKNALSLLNFHFSSGDLIVLGNEYDGLTDEFAAGADVLLHVPTPAAWLPKERSFSPIDPARIESVSRQGQPSLNVAMTAGILCYAAYAQLLSKQSSQTMPSGTVAH